MILIEQSFTVYGEPRGKGRPRFARGRTYTDSNTVEYEREVAKAWESVATIKFSKTPTEVTIKAFFSVPSSLSKKRKAALYGTPCQKKPDADNIAKIILDGLNSVAIEDDAQVNLLKVEKMYVESETALPRVEVTLRA